MLKEFFMETEQEGHELEDRSKGNRKYKLAETIKDKRTQLFLQK